MKDLQINDLFWTIQGEGKNSGRRAMFVRLPFCNLACSWCDTSFNSYRAWTEEAFVQFANQEKARLAVITGGEPTMNKHMPSVVELLKENGFEIACESNGTFEPPCVVDHLTISPKRFAKDKKFPPYYIHPLAEPLAAEFKYVVDSEFDFSILDRHNLSDGRRYYLSPEWNDFDANLKRIIEFQQQNPGWSISLQTHKFMKVP